jgi:hypothetical protein
MDIEAWREGFRAGTRLAPPQPPYASATLEAWSWHRGFIEGAAKRLGRRYSEQPPTDVAWPALPRQTIWHRVHHGNSMAAGTESH